MKMRYLMLLFAFLCFVPGCKPKAKPAAPTIFTSGNSTFAIGQVIVNGTNIPMSNVTITVIQDTNGSPGGKGTSK
ncbi:MAG TPA: hypothetical protein VMH87_16850 [Pseudomonadales bacterium]|nr:hypothetical protein [Pseudomonadales bacterium]